MDAVASVGRRAMAVRLARKLANRLAHVARRVVPCRSVTVVTRAHVGRRARSVHASFLAKRRTAVLFRPDETLPTLAHIGRYTGTVATRHADGSAPIVRVLLEPVVASANVGLRACAVRAILIANRFTGRGDRRVRDLVDHLRSNRFISSV